MSATELFTVRQISITRDGLVLGIALPEPWQVLAPEFLEEMADRWPTDAVGGALRAVVEVGGVGTTPDLTALLRLTPTSDDGTPLGLVLASLMTATLPAHEAPAPDAAMYEPVVRTIEFAEGEAADFLTLTVPVTSADGESVILATFASPNLPLREFLIEGWSNIAATITLERLAV